MKGFACLFNKLTRFLFTILSSVTWAGFAFSYYGTIIAVTLVFSETQDTENTTLSTNATTTSFDFDYGAIFASA
jgi:hypothetical protein